MAAWYPDNGQPVGIGQWESGGSGASRRRSQVTELFARCTIAWVLLSLTPARAALDMQTQCCRHAEALKARAR